MTALVWDWRDPGTPADAPAPKKIGPLCHPGISIESRIEDLRAEHTCRGLAKKWGMSAPAVVRWCRDNASILEEHQVTMTPAVNRYRVGYEDLRSKRIARMTDGWTIKQLAKEWGITAIAARAWIRRWHPEALR